MPRRLLAVLRSAGPSAAALGLLCAVACASPTLPLPPPEAPTQTQVDADHIKLTAGCGGAQAGADIIIINQTLELTNPDEAGVVSLASGCGSWDATLLAHSNDMLTITQESGGLSSTATMYTVP